MNLASNRDHGRSMKMLTPYQDDCRLELELNATKKKKNDKIKKMQSQDDDLANLTSYTFGKVSKILK